MTALSSRIAVFADRRPKLVALLVGTVSATGFAPLNLWPLTLIAFAALMALVVRSPRGWRAFGIGWAFGVGHFTLGLNWIATAFTYQAAMPAWLGWVAVLLLALFLAVYPALAAWGAWWVTLRFTNFRHSRVGGSPSPAVSAMEPGQAMNSRLRGNDEGKKATLPFILAFAALWIVTEWLRSWVFSGFAWNPLSAVLLPTEVLPYFAKGIGTYGLSAVAIYLAGTLIEFRWHWRNKSSNINAKIYTATIVVVLAIFAIAPWVRPSVEHLTDGSVRITIVQPNVGQADKWVGTKADANFAKLAGLTRAAPDAPPRLILWPEVAIPDYLETGYPPVYYARSPAAARARLSDLMNPQDVMLLGALKLELDSSGEVVGARNAVMTVRADGTLGQRYDKAHLVPYSEYLPMRPLLSAIGLSRLAPGDLDFWPGPGARTLDLGQFGSAGLQICYEIIFSGQVVDRANRPDFLVNPSNDAWFGSWGPPQHLAQARLRAIEEGLPVVRVTPTGISAVIDADGRIRAAIAQHVAGRIDTMLPPAHAPTLFARYGNILPLAFAALLLLAAIAIGRRRR